MIGGLRKAVPEALFVLCLGLGAMWFFSGCCRAYVITYGDGAQAVYVDGRWWTKSKSGTALFLMPAGWTPEAR